MRGLPKQQRGLTFISLVFVLGLIAFFTLLVLKIGPIYFNNSKVVNALAALEKMDGIESMSAGEIRNSLEKRFNMNYVDHVTVKDDVKIVSQPGYVNVEIDYERIEPMFGNLSVLVEFHEGFEVGSR